jgi:hypothetical protein
MATSKNISINQTATYNNEAGSRTLRILADMLEYVERHPGATDKELYLQAWRMSQEGAAA